MLAVSLRAAFWFGLVWFGLVWFVLFCFVLVCFVLFCFVLFCPRALHSADVALAPLSHIDSAAAEQSWAVALNCASSDSIQPDASYTDGRVCTKVTRRYKLANQTALQTCKPKCASNLQTKMRFKHANQNALQTCKPNCGSGCVVARAVESRAFAEQRLCV